MGATAQVICKMTGLTFLIENRLVTDRQADTGPIIYWTNTMLHGKKEHFFIV